MDTPETRYVAVGDADVAYQVVGEGPPDLLYFYGLGTQLDLLWDMPEGADYMRRLASFCRLILFDRRGTGASDPVDLAALPTWETWSEDLGAVLDTVGSRRAALFAALDSGPIAILYAATHPERVSALILFNSTARYMAAEDYPIGVIPEEIDAVVETIGSLWGTPDLFRAINPNRADDVDTTRLRSKMARAAATPRSAKVQYDYLMRHEDVRQFLPLVQAPTLIFHTNNPLVPIAHGRYLAEHVPDASLIELPGGDLNIDDFSRTFTDAIGEFLTGERPVLEIDRILTTVLFTDIVGSTELAVSLGDQRWRELLDAHDRRVRDQIKRHRGREINTTGDGFFVTFDGPARAIRCAQSIIEMTHQLDLDLRVGLHTGECEVRGDDLGGLAVHIAARVGSLAEPGEVLVSGTVRDLVGGSGIDFLERGEHELKGVPGSWKLFAVQA
jgi:class 3 adenylate cyclase